MNRMLYKIDETPLDFHGNCTIFGCLKIAEDVQKYFPYKFGFVNLKREYQTSDIYLHEKCKMLSNV